MLRPQVREITLLESIIASEVLSDLEVDASSRFFFLERLLGGLEEKEVYKLPLASTPKRCETILVVPEQAP